MHAPDYYAGDVLNADAACEALSLGFRRQQKRRGNAEKELWQHVNHALIKHTLTSDYLRTLDNSLYRDNNKISILRLHFFRAGQVLFEENFATAAQRARPVPVLATPDIKGALPDRNGWFTAEIAAAQNLLPPGAKTLLAMDRVQTHLTRRFADGHVAPPPDFPGKDAAAYFGDGIVVVPEEHMNTKRKRHIVSSFPRSYCLHEYGHAFKDIIDNSFILKTSANDRLFLSAYRKDMSALKKLPMNKELHPQTVFYSTIDADTDRPLWIWQEQWDDKTSFGRRKNLDYFLPASEGGCHDSWKDSEEEAFAELFAARIQGKDYDRLPKLLETFRHSAAAMDKIIAAVEYEMASPRPDLKSLLGPTLERALL